MNVIATNIPDVLILEPTVFGDDRGFFFESYNARAFRQAVGREVLFVQDNHSRSAKNVLRGFHYQIEQAQAKLVRVTEGAVFDVAVDIRRSSATFAQWVGVELSANNKRQLWIPEGFAHGYCVLSQYAYVAYKCSDYYDPDDEGGLLWSDPDIGIDWPVKDPILSAKDRQFGFLKDLKL